MHRGLGSAEGLERIPVPRARYAVHPWLAYVTAACRAFADGGGACADASAPASVTRRSTPITAAGSAFLPSGTRSHPARAPTRPASAGLLARPLARLARRWCRRRPSGGRGRGRAGAAPAPPRQRARGTGDACAGAGEAAFGAPAPATGSSGNGAGTTAGVAAARASGALATAGTMASPAGTPLDGAPSAGADASADAWVVAWSLLGRCAFERGDEQADPHDDDRRPDGRAPRDPRDGGARRGGADRLIAPVNVPGSDCGFGVEARTSLGSERRWMGIVVSCATGGRWPASPGPRRSPATSTRRPARCPPRAKERRRARDARELADHLAHVLEPLVPIARQRLRKNASMLLGRSGRARAPTAPCRGSPDHAPDRVARERQLPGQRS